MALTPAQQALWANDITRDCLIEAGDDVDAALAAAEYIISTQPIHLSVDVEGRGHCSSINAFFSFDIHNRDAQGILNRALRSARRLSVSARKELAAAIKRGAADRGEAILKFIDKYRLQLARLLTTTQLAALLEGAREVAAKVPPLGEVPVEGLPVAEQEAAISIAREASRESIRLPDVAPGAPEAVHLVTIDRAVRDLSEKNVMDRARFDALDAAARAKAFTVAGVEAEETLTKIRDALAENVAKGADYETFRKEVLDAVDEGTFLSDAHQETVFRTNVQSAFSDGQASVLAHPLVRSGFPYSTYDAIHDDRVRANHLALEEHGISGTNIYRNDDPVFQLFRPPWDYSDRCSWTPITVRQAAERGIKEAQEWLDTGIEPAQRAFVDMPPFSPPPGFQRALATAPLSIQLSMRPMGSFGTSLGWITVGGRPDPETGEKHVGGVHIQIDEGSGQVRKGPPGLRGEPIGTPKRQVPAPAPITTPLSPSFEAKQAAVKAATDQALGKTPPPAPASFEAKKQAIVDATNKAMGKTTQRAQTSQSDAAKTTGNGTRKAIPVKKIKENFRKFTRSGGPGENIIDFEDAEPFIGTKYGPYAALQAFTTGSYSEINTQPDHPISRAMMKLVNALPDTNIPSLVRGMAFPTDEERNKFLSKLKVGGVYKQERTFSSWNDSKLGVEADITSQYGTFNVVMNLRNPSGAKDISEIYGGGTGSEVLTKKGDAHRVVDVKKKGDTYFVTLESTGSKKLSITDSSDRKTEEETDTSLLYDEPEVGTIASAMLDTAKEPKGKTTRVGRDVKKRIPKGRHRTLFKRLRVKKRWLRSVSLAVDDEGDGTDRLQLIAEILVLLFRDKAGEETKKLLGDTDVSAALAMLATPKVTRRYGKQPGPGWTRGGTSRKGQQIWIYGASSDGAAAAPTPTAPTPPTPAPTPSAPAPAPTPPTAGSPAPSLRAGGQQARASSIAAYNDAMKKLTPNPSLGYPGRQLTTPEKAALARKLTNMPISMLRSLHTALGGTGATGNMKATVTAVKSLLTGKPAAAAASPTPSPTPTPTPTPTPSSGIAGPAPVFNTGYSDFDDAVNNVLSGKVLTAQQITSAENVALVSVSNSQVARAITALGGIVRNPNGSFALSSDLRDALDAANNKNIATQTTPTPTPTAPSPTGTPGTRPVDKLMPALQPHAANIRAIALAYSDGFISRTEAIIGIAAETRQLNNLGLKELASAMGVGPALFANPNSYISAVANADPGHPVTSNPYIPIPSPPGPPPRPGLVWNPTTHRWILAPTPAPAPTPSPAPMPFAKARRTPLGTPPVTPSGPVPPETIFTTGTPQPGTLNGVAFSSAPPKFWEKVKDVDIGEPPPARHIDRASVMIQEPDGRIWIVKPTNDYGSRGHTFPGGGVEPGLTDQQNALKEVWEETGLQVEITGHLGDFKDSNTGKNGRLYIGRRVGGAPWDAKIESHIIDQKTGKPAAESETVVLATPEHALKLLKRTDDLAQLMTVNPIPIDTAVEGTGSEPLKKLVDALEPARKAYEGQKKAKGQTKTGNAYLHTIQDMRGLNEKPKVISKSDMDKLIAQGGHIEMMRGLKDAGYGRGAQTAKEMAEEFKRGDHFSGYGIFGSGTYADATKGHNNVCTQYAGYGGSGAIIRMALPKTAKIITFAELEKKVPKAPELFKNNGYEAGGSGSVTECWRGVQAALAGYDAIVQDGNSVSHRHYGTNFHIILNRSILVVQEEDAAGHRIK